MNYSKEIVCLASSKKKGGRCVAGREILDGGYGPWIRPVSTRPTAEITLEERQYSDGQEPKILDVIGIPMLSPVARLHQTENHMIDDTLYWEKARTLSWDEVKKLEESPDTLWVNGDSTYHGLNDRILQATAAQLNNSLVLIKPEDVGTPIRRLLPTWLTQQSCPFRSCKATASTIH